MAEQSPHGHPSAVELRARIVAALLPGPDDAVLASRVAADVVDLLPGSVAVDLVRLLEAPLAHSTRLHAALLAERFPRTQTTTVEGQTTTVEGVSRG